MTTKNYPKWVLDREKLLIDFLTENKLLDRFIKNARVRHGKDTKLGELIRSRIKTGNTINLLDHMLRWSLDTDIEWPDWNRKWKIHYRENKDKLGQVPIINTIYENPF